MPINTQILNALTKWQVVSFIIWRNNMVSITHACTCVYFSQNVIQIYAAVPSVTFLIFVYNVCKTVSGYA